MGAVKRFLQGLEGAGQRAAIRGVTAVTRRASRVDLAQARRILFLRHDAIGDMVMTTGVLRHLREQRPALEIDVLASRSNARVLEGLPFVSRVLLHQRGDTAGMVRRLRPEFRAREYDAVLDGRVIWPRVSTDTAFLIAASGAPRAIGIGNRRADFAYTDRVCPDKRAHMIEHMAALTAPLGLDPARGDWRPVLHVSDDERRAAADYWDHVRGAGPKLLVNISAGLANRRWPIPRFIAALQAVRETHVDARIFVMAPPQEAEAARAVAEQVRATAGQPDLRAAFAMVQQADLVFTPDTSIAHAASAFQTPVVGMYLSWMIDNFRPYQTPGRCVTVDAPTLDALDVPPVVDALRAELAQSSPRASAGA